MDDYCADKDIYLHAVYCDASKFVSSENDDVELVDVVVDDPSKKMWHCSDVLKSNMLRHAFIGACMMLMVLQAHLSLRSSKMCHSSNVKIQFNLWVLFYCSPLNCQTVWLLPSCICFLSTSMMNAKVAVP